MAPAREVGFSFNEGLIASGVCPLSEVGVTEMLLLIVGGADWRCYTCISQGPWTGKRGLSVKVGGDPTLITLRNQGG